MLEAARLEFARHGLHGASTDAIARRAGISQPYLFRLFGSKKELFLAVNDACFARTLDLVPRGSVREVGRGRARRDRRGVRRAASRATARCSRASCRRTPRPSIDDDIRECGARGYGRLVDYVETVSGADRQTVARFFAKGMLMNVLAAMHYSIRERAEGLLGRTSGRGVQGGGRVMRRSLFFLQQLSNQSLDRNQSDTRRSR